MPINPIPLPPKINANEISREGEGDMRRAGSEVADYVIISKSLGIRLIDFIIPKHATHRGSDLIRPSILVVRTKKKKRKKAKKFREIKTKRK